MFSDIRHLQDLLCDTPYDSTTFTGNIYCEFDRDNTVHSVSSTRPYFFDVRTRYHIRFHFLCIL
jgi:hypothetical protein